MKFLLEIFIALLTNTVITVFLYFFPFLKPNSLPTNLPISPTTTPTVTPTISSPSAKLLTFAEKNSLYGPCTKLPVLMYHHIQDAGKAKIGGYSGLTVNPASFQKDLEYLRDHNYQTIGPEDLIAFFDRGIALPSKAVMLTFDDGYDDFALFAAPLLIQFNMKASMYLPTGLVENPGYLTWNKIDSLKNNIYFGNHTWSHHSMKTDQKTIESEIQTAEKQLQDRGLNQYKTFIYPYGATSKEAIKYLQSANYSLAFTTVPGDIMCKKQRLTLPRLRASNASLSQVLN